MDRENIAPIPKAGMTEENTIKQKGKEVLDDLSAKGEQVRREQPAPDFARSMQDIFTQAGGAFSDVTERLGAKGSTVAERILDELILARARTLTMSERVEFMAHVRDLVDSVDDATVTVEVEAQEPATDEAASVDAQDDAPADSVASAEAEDVE